jgi:uncharacterized membrane protein
MTTFGRAHGGWLGHTLRMEEETVEPVRYDRDTPEFARVANLSDAVFAIAMTLLVLTLDVPDPAAGPLAEALLDTLPQLIAFVLAFALVANIWWEHHKFMARLATLDRPLIGATLVLLGAVALVPYPTSLIGMAPTDSAAAVPFIGLFVFIGVLILVLHWHAQRAGAWLTPWPDRLTGWVLGGWGVLIGGLVLALVVAVFVPLAGLAMAALNGWVVTIVMGSIAPPGYRVWGP